MHNHFDKFDREVDQTIGFAKKLIFVTIAIKLAFAGLLIWGIVFLVSNCSEIAKGAASTAGELYGEFEEAKEK